MKHIIVIMIVFSFFAGCKENEPTKEQPSKKIQGGIKLLDEVGNERTNMSGIKITIVESGQSQITDSAGKFYFPEVTSDGKIDIKCEYENYPPMYLQHLILEYGVNEVYNVYWNREEYNTISPTAKLEYVIDSVENTTRTYGNYFIQFHAHYQKPFGKLTYLFLVGRKADSLDYTSGKYDYFISDWNRSLPGYGSNDTVKISGIVLDKTLVSQLGYKSGDSMYCRIFPLTTIDYYFENEWNGKRVYPSIGKGSNVFGFKIK